MRRLGTGWDRSIGMLPDARHPFLTVARTLRAARLAQLLERAAAAPVTLLVGPAGSGKSVAVRALTANPATLCFRVGRERRTFARFAHGLAEAIASVAPGAQASFARAWERSLQSRSPAAALARWLCEHLDGSAADLVIDDLHDIAADPSIATCIATIAQLRTKARLIITARTVGALPVALWMATGQLVSAPIDEADLAFRQEEIAELAQQAGAHIGASRVCEILLATNGLAIAVAYALARPECDWPQKIFDIPASFEAVAADVFARRTQVQKNFLFAASPLPDLDDDLLRMLGWDQPGQIRCDMGRDASVMWGCDDRGAIRFHDRFHEYLERRFQSLDMDLRSNIIHQAVEVLASAGRHAAALEVATRQPFIKAMGELLDTHGFEMLESGAVDAISDALATVEESSLGATGIALRGYMEARSGRLDTAEAWFRLALDTANDETSRATIAIYYARELTKRRREDACAVLAEFAASKSLSRTLLIDVRSSLARALVAADQFAEASVQIEGALALLDDDVSPALRARVFERAAFVALYHGDPDAARRYARIAAPLAAANSLYEVAASTYATLYNLAYDIDDDAALTREYLERNREMGAKSGILRADLFGKIALYELCAEAGDEAALTAVKTQLAALDTTDAVTYFVEALIPSQALQAAWSGCFDDAQRFIRPTAERQATPARRALSWSQVCLYAAGAANAETAREASQACKRALDGIERREIRTTQHGLALLNLALASLFGGDVEDARRWSAAADDSVIGSGRRLHALRAAVEAMIAGFDDGELFAQRVPPTLVTLEAESFGGMAKLIKALPYPFRASSAARTTVGAELARTQLAARFAGREAADARRPSRDTSLSTETARWATVGAPTSGLIDAVDVALESLFEQLDVASPLMGEHSRAVAAWCSRLGRTIGLCESEIEFVRRCGLIHDIGKIWTPLEILDAPRKLTAEEWVIMRAHTTDGSSVVAKIPILSPFVPIVRGHHERLDGKGYPDGLPAHEIPLAARIVAVADCFNAMIGRRPYRPAMAPTAALSELERHRGTQFDPEIVEAMVQIVLGLPVESPAVAV